MPNIKYILYERAILLGSKSNIYNLSPIILNLFEFIVNKIKFTQ